MEYQINAIDAYNFQLLLSNGVKIETFRSEEYLGYHLDIPTEKGYYILLKYLQRVFHRDHVTPIYQADGIWEEELYCFVTENVLVRYYFDSDTVAVKINADTENHRLYDAIIVGFYSSTEYLNY
jgi:hypothetical protein